MRAQCSINIPADQGIHFYFGDLLRTGLRTVYRSRNRLPVFIPLVLAACSQEPRFIRTPDILFLETPMPIVQHMLDWARPGEGDLVYDLGCGDGRFVIEAARRFGARGIGVDIDPERVRESRANVRAAGLEHLVEIRQADIFELDLSGADVVTLYLLTHLNTKLVPQLETMSSGARILSHDYGIWRLPPERYTEIYEKESRRKHRVFYWETPLKFDPDYVPP